MSLRDTSAFKPLRSTFAYVIIAVIRGDDMLKRIKYRLFSRKLNFKPRIFKIQPVRRFLVTNE